MNTAEGKSRMHRILLPYVLGRMSPIPYLFEGITPHFTEDFTFRSLGTKDVTLPDTVSTFRINPNCRAQTLTQYVRLSLSNSDLIHTGPREAHYYVSQVSKFHNPNIGHVHSFRVDVDPEGKFNTSVVSKSGQRADVVTAVSKHTADTVRKHLDLDPEVIYNGVDTEWFHPDYDRPPLFDNYNLDDPLFLYIGSMERRKRPDHVLDTAEAIPEASFLLAGDGPMLNELRSRASTLDNVELPGRVAKDRLPAIYANACALVFPTVREGCPNVVLESMAAGTPVVGYRATSMPELINHGETGLLAPVDDIDVFTDCVKDLTERDTSEMGAAARSYILENHTFDTIAADYESLYRTLL